MSWWTSVGLKPNEIVVRAPSSIIAEYKISKYIENSPKYYGELAGVDEVTGKKRISDLDFYAAKMRRSNKSTMMDFDNNVHIIGGKRKARH